MTESSKKLINEPVERPKDHAQVREASLPGSVSSKVTHEVGNLLNNVGLTLSTLKKERLSAKAEKAVTILEKESQRVKRFMFDSLQFEKESELNLARQPVESIIRDIMFVHGANAEKRGVRLTLRWPSQLPAIHVDGHLMYQVLNNLVKNSLEAITGAGDIRIEGSSDEKFLFIKVQDTGAGIRRNALQAIFDPFFTTKGEKGTGLGLSIVKSIVEAHGGTVECQSDLGKGTSFTLRIPQG